MGHYCSSNTLTVVNPPIPQKQPTLKSHGKRQESIKPNESIKLDQFENLNYVVSELLSQSGILQEYFILSKAEEALKNEKKLLNTKIKWKKGELIKKTPNGNTYQGFNLNNGQIIVIKSLKIKDSLFHSEIKNITENLSILRQLNDEYIVTYYDLDIRNAEHKIYLIEEYVPAGSLKNLIEKFGAFDEKLVQIYTKQILIGIEKIHSKGIVHGNLKCSNILVDINAKIKFTDFVLSTANLLAVESEQDTKENDAWSSPEYLKKRKLETPSDIWSFGCIIIEMITGVSPYPMLIKNYINNDLSESHSELYNSFLTKMSNNLRQFLQKIFKINPLERPTISELLNDPFLSNTKKNSAEMTLLLEQISIGISRISQTRISLIQVHKEISNRFSKIKTSFNGVEEIIENKQKEEERKKCEDMISEEVERIKKLLENNSNT